MNPPELQSYPLARGESPGASGTDSAANANEKVMKFRRFGPANPTPGNY